MSVHYPHALGCRRAFIWPDGAIPCTGQCSRTAGTVFRSETVPMGVTSRAWLPFPPLPAEAQETSRPPSDGLLVDAGRRSVIVEGRQLALGEREFELLAHLVANPLLVHSRTQLMRAVWQQQDAYDVRTVDTHVARLRRKLGPRYRATIVTVRGAGYKFDPALRAG
jgi:DNA-binding response OmpR family regulator